MGISIPSVDAKDLYIANNQKVSDLKGFSLIRKDGLHNLKKFKNTLDYSLDLINLREVYQKVYRNSKFSFIYHEKEYSDRIINVTFKYSNKEFNKISKDIYVRFGYPKRQIDFTDCVLIENIDGEPYLTAIQTNTAVPEDKRVSDELLGGEFEYLEGKYQVKKNSTLNTVKELREELYKHGFYCDGTHYVRFKRSSGSSRVGKCLYIDEKLYPMMHKWESLGLKVLDGQPIDLAAYEAYISLTLSSIVDTIQIRPENILLIDDYESIFEDDVIATTFDEEAGRLKTAPRKTMIHNSLWDGQSLIDKSLLDMYSQYGMAVLRTNFFKTCAFNTNIQEFLADNNITSISQLNGKTIAKDIKDIKLITTPSSIKFLKFGTFEQWINKIDTTFGIVKHEKKTHFFDGRMVQTHYQLLNTLQLSKQEVADFLKPSLDYWDLINTDPAVLRYYIKYPEFTEFTDEPIDASDKNEIIFRLMGLNEKFCSTSLYKDFKKGLNKAYRRRLRAGHIFVNGNYSTLLGNPMEMLLQSIGTFDGTSYLEEKVICNTYFKHGETLLGSRSPHACQGNILLAQNMHNEVIFKYFNLTNEIVCINAINSNILQQLSGADYDGDTLLLTNDRILVMAARRNYDVFKIPTCMVDSIKSKRYYTDEQKADLDFKTSVNKIGEIINLSQLLVTLYWDKRNNGASHEELSELYYDTCQLDIMSGIEIDKAKKEFPEVDGIGINELELKRMREKYLLRDDDERKILPYFFKFIEQDKGYYNSKKKYYKHHNTTMDYLEEIINCYIAPKVHTETLQMLDILDFKEFKPSMVKYEQIEKIKIIISGFRDESVQIWKAGEHISKSSKYLHHMELLEEVINEINSIKLNMHTMFWLLKNIDSNEDLKKIKTTYMCALFNAANENFYTLIKNSQSPIPMLYEYEEGNIELHGLKFTKKIKKEAKKQNFKESNIEFY